MMNKGLYGFGSFPDLGYSGYQQPQLTDYAVRGNVAWSPSTAGINPSIGMLCDLGDAPVSRRIRVRSTRFWDSTGQTLAWRFNETDSGSNYSRQDILSNGTTASATQANASTSWHAGNSHSSTGTSTYTAFNIYYPNELRPTGTFALSFPFDRHGSTGTMGYRFMFAMYNVPNGIRYVNRMITSSIGNWTFANFMDYSVIL